MSSPSDEEQKSLKKILFEYLANERGSSFLQKETFCDLLSQEIKGEMKEASLSFESLMQIQQKLKEVYFAFIDKEEKTEER